MNGKPYDRCITQELLNITVIVLFIHEIHVFAIDINLLQTISNDKLKELSEAVVSYFSCDVLLVAWESVPTPAPRNPRGKD